MLVLSPLVLALTALAFAFGSLGAAQQATLSAAGEAVQAAAEQLTLASARRVATQAATATAAHNCASTTTTLSGTFTPGSTIRVAVTCQMHPLPGVPAVTLHSSEAGIVAMTQDVSP